jgi:hypothetical protein
MDAGFTRLSSTAPGHKRTCSRQGTLRDFDADHAERSNARESPSNRRLAIEPRPRLLKLPGQAEERRLVAVARNELN